MRPSLVVALALLRAAAAQYLTPGQSTPTLSLRNMSAALDGYPGHDLAVFLYSPYGEAGAYCRRVLPLWDAVAEWRAKKKIKRLVVGKFACDATAEHRRLCLEAGVRQYPTIVYLGYGALQAPWWLRLGAPKQPRRSATYRGIAAAEGLRDWARVLHWVSEAQRRWSGALQLLGWRPSELEREVASLRAELARR
eukprot:CAMPEP_0119290954 /NCGR_PEP_ID=MMETSP1329-20130426/41610_1 /TAXON_ID=114041 /ORGANISM="Genus nov. species nov., Strain RCC1024" /LENGTH=193 /DNA_ID=CAMNT_0007291775 /DNA_START=77 /DNA_END=655 /DNA_ORIENTATION=+